MEYPERFSPSDTMKVEDEPRSSATVLEAIRQAQKTFEQYNHTCNRIDMILSAKNQLLSSAQAIGFTDQEFDIFWASTEILKPAIYAKPPRIVVSPRFKDGSSTDKTVAELMERVLNSEFERSDIDQVMLDMRDDLAVINRGIDWVSLDDGEICLESLDRVDFLHEPARKWTEVSWVARCAYMTRQQMADRFRDKSGQAYEQASFLTRNKDEDRDAVDGSAKAAVWEVWSKADKRVYWVSEGVDVFLDEDKPHLDLDKGFPCPRPAYGSKQRRSLVPVPDYLRYEALLEQINEATIKIYDLLEQVKVRGLIPAGGDVGSALETAINEQTSAMFIPVPAAAFNSAGANGLIQWVPIDQIATTVTGLIQARQQLFDDFYQLSGISDIMRGATEAQETLGAQRLKGQYGSIRIKDKIDELVRVARDTACIAGEIICDNYSQKKLLEIGQMEIPTRKEIDKKIEEITKAAKGELEQLGAQMEEAAPQIQAQGPEASQQAQQQFNQAQQQIIAKYSPLLEQLSNTVVIEDIMKVIKDKRTRGLVIDIETDSTVMVDEMAEKQSRSEFLQAFSSATASVMPLMQSGEAGAKLAGAIIKFSLQPFNAGRELDAMIDDFIDKAPELAAQQGEGQQGSQDLIAAQNKLAEAEMVKAQAAVESVKAKSMKDQAEMSGKMQEMQLKYEKDKAQFMLDNEKLRLQQSKQEQEFAAKMADMDAKQNLMQAQTAEILAKIGLDVRKQDLEEYKAANEVQRAEVDTALRVEQESRANRGEDRAERQQDFNERQTMSERDV